MNSILRSVLTLSVFIFGAANQLSAQKNEDRIYVFDENWNGTTVEKARYLMRAKKIKDSSWQWDTYNILGPLIKTEFFKDEKGTIAEGEFYFYNAKGKLDSIHNYLDGLAHGKWFYLNDTGRIYLSKEYDKGILKHTIDVIQEDSLRELEAEDDEDNDLLNIKSEFPGKAKGWLKYLEKNFKYPERALNNKISGQVVVQFVVDTEGYVIQPRIYRSVEFSIDEEALRLIRKSPQWMPASQNGRKVKSYKRQPVVFQFQ